jgi:hypothetical protein
MRRSIVLAPVLLAGVTILAPSAAADDQAGHRPNTDATIAEYNGRMIDLSQGWEGAKVCAEQEDSSFRCYEDDSAYRTAEGIGAPDDEFGTRDLADCAAGYLCLWDDQDGGGRRVQFNQPGRHDLESVGFRNSANSVGNHRNAIALLWDSGHQVSPVAGKNRIYSPLSAIQGPSGTWNNKIDVVELFTS